MNPFRSFFNRAPAPTVAVTMIHSETGEVRTLMRPQAPIPGDKRTGDERHFGIDLYVPGVGYRRGRFFFQNPPAISPELLASVLDESGPLWSADDQKAIATISSQLKRADDQLCENSFARVSQILPVFFQAQIDSAVAEGTQPPSVPSYQERLAQTTHVRAALHWRKKKLWQQAFAILKPGIQKFSNAAWAMARSREKEERGGLLARWKLTFNPSPLLKAIVYLALRAGEPIRDFDDNGIVDVSTDPVRLWGYLLDQPGAGQPAVGPTTMQEERARQRENEDRRRQGEMDEEAAEHKRKLAEISAFNDSIRLQNPNSPAPTGYSAQVVPRPEAEQP